MDKTWVVADTDHLGGKSRVRDTRISVVHLLEMFASGMTIPEIIDAYPSLSEFMTHFNKTNWDEYVNGDDWP